MDCAACVPRKPWQISFLAEPREVAGLRRVVRLHLSLWGLHDLTDAAQICVSELVSNVIRHVGQAAPTALTVSMRDTFVRIEVQDFDPHTSPIFAAGAHDEEAGRGLTLINALSERWGVEQLGTSKVIWCELGTALTHPYSHSRGPRVREAEYAISRRLPDSDITDRCLTRVELAMAEKAAIDIITDLLHWFTAHGRDVDDALDRAQAELDATMAQ